MRWIVVVFSFLVAGWLAFDGAWALVKGDYITPKSGPNAGRLGPWANVVSAVGIEPRSTLMKVAYASYGYCWLGVIAAFVLRAPWSWAAMALAALGSLWFAPVGTILGLAQIVLLFLLRRESGG